MPYKDKVKNAECKRAYYLKNREEAILRAKLWKVAHHDVALAYDANYRKNNSAKRKEYLIKNADKIRKQARQYRSEKLKTDPNFKIACNLRIRVNKALKNNSKAGHTLVLLGCTIEELKLHLQSKFIDGMSWNNYGQWHIDHITPCFSFDLSKKEEQKKCFHYTNLQPLWALDNLCKNKYE